MKQRGFTLIEIMVAIVVVAIIIMVAIPAIIGSSGSSNISWGINGMTESRCIEGYKFIISQEGGTRQILDEFGKGVRCEMNEIKPGSFGKM